MNLKSTISLYAVAGGDSSLVHPPGLVTDTPKVRDMARKRLVKTNPDVDAAKYKEKSQTDENAFTGKKFRVQDTKYGHMISEHEDEDDARHAALTRPYSRVLKHEEPNQSSKNRAKTRKKVVNTNVYRRGTQGREFAQ